jgi:hypothetical protein
MGNNLKEKLAESGWILTNDNFEPPFNFKEELRYNLIGYSVSILAVIPLLMVLVFLYFYLRLKGKNKRPRMLFGTHAVITFKLLKQVLEENHDCTLFAFKDDFHKVENIDVITAEDIMPKWIAKKYPYLLGRYWAFVWAIKNFDIFHLYFDGGFLDRTMWWRLEPIIYQLFGKKVILFPYGADIWDTFRNTNRLHKFGSMCFMPKYFNMDFKRLRRMYHWAKYVNLIFGAATCIDFLPRIDILAFYGQIFDNKENYNYSFPEITGKIKIIHYANHSARKGSNFIKKILCELKKERDDFEFELCEGLQRDTALEKLNDAHIFIDNIADGFLNYSTIEAMLKGKVVLANLSEDLMDFYRYLNYNYYEKFFKTLPIIKIDLTNLKDKLMELLNNKENLKAMSRKNRKFIEETLDESEKAYKLVILNLVNKI